MRSNSETVDADVVEGYSAPLFVRIAGLFCFLVINPLFIYIWINKPKFVAGPIDFPEIFMGIVTVGMLTLGVAGLMMNFARTCVSAESVEWGLFTRKVLKLENIRYVKKVIFNNTWLMLVMTKAGKKVSVPGGTEELCEAFLVIQRMFPEPVS